jgi:hypothetical protein
MKMSTPMNSREHLAQAAAAARGLAEALGALAKDAPVLDADADTYDSTRLPPRTSRRRFAELCRSNRVPGARQEGMVWVCPRQAWHAARSRRKEAAAPSRPSFTPEQSVDALLSRRGLRLIDKGRSLPRTEEAE